MVKENKPQDKKFTPFSKKELETATLQQLIDRKYDPDSDEVKRAFKKEFGSADEKSEEDQKEGKSKPEKKIAKEKNASVFEAIEKIEQKMLQMEEDYRAKRKELVDLLEQTLKEEKEKHLITTEDIPTFMYGDRGGGYVFKEQTDPEARIMATYLNTGKDERDHFVNKPPNETSDAKIITKEQLIEERGKYFGKKPLFGKDPLKESRANFEKNKKDLYDTLSVYLKASGPRDDIAATTIGIKIPKGIDPSPFMSKLAEEIYRADENIGALHFTQGMAKELGMEEFDRRQDKLKKVAQELFLKYANGQVINVGQEQSLPKEKLRINIPPKNAVAETKSESLEAKITDIEKRRQEENTFLSKETKRLQDRLSKLEYNIPNSSGKIRLNPDGSMKDAGDYYDDKWDSNFVRYGEEKMRSNLENDYQEVKRLYDQDVAQLDILKSPFAEKTTVLANKLGGLKQLKNILGKYSFEETGDTTSVDYSLESWFRYLVKNPEKIDLNKKIIDNELAKLEKENVSKKDETTKIENHSVDEKLPSQIDTYLSFPNSDGSFNESSARKSFTPGATLYSFQNIGGNKYEVYVNQDPGSIKLALQFPERSFDPIFEAISATNLNAKTLQTIEPAVVELENGKFKLISKGKMDFDRVGIERESGTEKDSKNPELVPPILENKENIKLMYCKLPELENGFAGSSLNETQNGEQIYELEIQGNKAEFSVSKDTGAQRYALSDYTHYLGKAGCEMLNHPVKSSDRIVTIKKGTLTKSDGNWIIETRAQIKFVSETEGEIKTENDAEVKEIPFKSKYYAKYADLGDGFRAENDPDRSDFGPDMFEILVQQDDKTAFYKVANNPEGQRYALGNAYQFFGDGRVAEYNSSQPFEGAKIITTAYGELKLSSDGKKWDIKKPVEIKFVENL